jgi:Sigma-70 region 2
MREEGDPRVGEVAAGLISRARAGDGDAFRELTEPHRRELQAHCYRMLGSFQDAEDALQDTLLAAWQGFGGFDGRASLPDGSAAPWSPRAVEPTTYSPPTSPGSAASTMRR